MVSTKCKDFSGTKKYLPKQGNKSLSREGLLCVNEYEKETKIRQKITNGIEFKFLKNIDWKYSWIQITRLITPTKQEKKNLIIVNKVKKNLPKRQIPEHYPSVEKDWNIIFRIKPKGSRFRKESKILEVELNEVNLSLALLRSTIKISIFEWTCWHSVLSDDHQIVINNKEKCQMILVFLASDTVKLKA